MPMFELLSSSLDKAVIFLGALGYAGVFWASFLDRLTVFLTPAEIVLPAFGILISQGKFSFWPVMIWLTAGNFLGNLGLYFIFLKGGRLFLEKYGKYFLITKHELSHLDKWFAKYGDKIVFWGYFIPSSGRSIVPIPAGITRMSLSKFSLYTFLGSMPLNFLYVYVGGVGLDEDINYEINGEKKIFAKENSGVAGIIVEEDVNGDVKENRLAPIGV